VRRTDHPAYDAVIIGSGISGLVCGNYLAKAGMKVLIAEQHHQPGGYCTSFVRRGITFDAAAHSFGGFRENGIIRKLFNDFQLSRKVSVTRYDPTDIIVSPDHTVSLRADLEQTIEGLKSSFPDEHDNFRKFAGFLLNPDPKSFAAMRRWTLKDLLDRYFQDDKLKSMLSFPIFGNGALPPSRMSAFIGAKIFTEFLLDGGYYPDGGMQTLSNALAESFQNAGGKLLLSSPVRKILIQNSGITGIVLKDNAEFTARAVISNCDARQTFLRLIGNKHLPPDFIDKLNRMQPALSMLVLYLGLDHDFKNTRYAGSNVWYLPHYDLEKMYRSAARRAPGTIDECMVRISPDRKSLMAFTNSTFRSRTFWADNKANFIDGFIARLSRILPDITQHIIYRDAATPSTMYRYTSNYRGSAYGWESTSEQLADSDFRRPSFIRNLYLTGHWSTQGLGIPGVAYLGYDIAASMLKRRKAISSQPSPE
jgi:phytoene dehydrogenase-like protein